LDVFIGIVVVLAHEKLAADKVVSRVRPHLLDLGMDLFKPGEMAALRCSSGRIEGTCQEREQT